MRISDPYGRNSISQTSASPEIDPRKARGSSDEKTAQVSSQDRVTLSPEAQEYALAAKLASEDEDARAAKVAELKTQIASGTYKTPSSEDVAGAILRHFRGEA